MCEATRGGGGLCGWGRWLPVRPDKSPDGKCTGHRNPYSRAMYEVGRRLESVRRRASLPSWVVASSAKVKPFLEWPLCTVCVGLSFSPHKDQRLQCAGPYGCLCGCLSGSCFFLALGTMWLVLLCLPNQAGFVSVIPRKGKDEIIGQVESWNCRMVWIGLEGTFKDHLVQQPPCHGQTPSTRPACSKPHPAWPWTLPGRGHPQLLWASCASASPPSE